VESLHKLDVVHAPEPFLGAMTNHPGPLYFVTYLFGTLPFGALVAVIVGAVRLAGVRSRGGLLAACWFVAPLGMMLSPVRQDGVRYVLPCLPALAMIGAAGIDQLATWLRGRGVFLALSSALLVYLGVVLAAI